LVNFKRIDGLSSMAPALSTQGHAGAAQCRRGTTTERPHRPPCGVVRVTRLRGSMRSLTPSQPLLMSLRQAVHALLLLGLCANAVATTAPTLPGRWQLTVRDPHGQLRAAAVVRFTDALAKSCIAGVWRRVAIDVVSVRDDRYFPLTEPLAYAVEDGKLRLGRTAVCDAYRLLSGLDDRDVIEGRYAGFGKRSTGTLGTFTLRRLGRSSGARPTPTDGQRTR
jgi:hypothetical protein